MSNEVLLLNADAQPISFLPLSSISWQDAIRLVYLDTADVLHNYDDWYVHSPSTTMQVPSVMMLREQVHNFRRWVAREHDGPQKQLLFLRDLYVCQYCGLQFSRKHLTADHVVPKVFGGRYRWENLVTSCAVCNCKRGCDMRIQPRMKPYRPTYGQLLKNMRTFTISVPHDSWNDYLQWETHKVKLIPRSGSSRYSNFGLPDFSLTTLNVA